MRKHWMPSLNPQPHLPDLGPNSTSTPTPALMPLHVPERRSTSPGKVDDVSIGADSFFVVSPRLTAHANATHAALLMARHIAHHRQLGFSGHSVFLNRCSLDHLALRSDYRGSRVVKTKSGADRTTRHRGHREHAGAFMAHSELAGHIQEGRLWLISEDFGMARVAVGAASNETDRHGPTLALDLTVSTLGHVWAETMPSSAAAWQWPAVQCPALPVLNDVTAS